MDAYSLVVAILVLLLIISLFYNFSYSNGFGPNNHTLDQPIPQAKERDKATKSKVTRKTVSTQSNIAPTIEVSQTVSDTHIGSEELDKNVDANFVNTTQTDDEFIIATNKHGTSKHKKEDEGTEINTFRSFINNDDLRKCMKKEGVFSGLCSYINKSVKTWKGKTIEIAVAGNSGTGKSTLINSLRGLGASDKGAAAVGVTETTTEPVRYEFPNNGRICISDLPGMGTVKFPREKYFEEMQISKYDAFIIVASGRITQDDVWFVRHVLHDSNPRHVLFVRTKIDFDLTNAKLDKPLKFKKDKCLSDIREEIRSNFENDYFKALRKNIYLISSRQKDQFDFPRLTRRLKDILNISGKSIRKLLEEEVYAFIKMKRELNKGEFFGRKVAAFISGLLPYSNYVPGSVKEIRSICKSKFGLNDKSLQTISDEIQMDVEDLKSKMSTFKYLEDEPSSMSPRRMWGFREYDTIQINLSKMCDQMSLDEKHFVNLKLEALEEDLCP